MKVGITGQNGFVNKHLYNTLGLQLNKFGRVVFQKEYFENIDKLDEFVKSCDVIVHLVAMNRHQREQAIFDTNLSLVDKLIASLKRAEAKPYAFISSLTQEKIDNFRGRSKKEGREKLVNWAENSNDKVTRLLIPNVFGHFGKRFYNSFIAFRYQLINGESPSFANTRQIIRIYVEELEV